LLIQKYNPEWKMLFLEIKDIIDSQLTGLIISVEHVGSTAVPGLAAKPIIDIDIVFKNDVDFSELTKKLKEIGYEHNGDQGISGREVFVRNLNTSIHSKLDSIKHHLYACSEGNEELVRHILFRDFLCLNESARIEYQKLKLNLSEETNHDHKKYAKLKETRASSFINDILEKAIAL
jgi:GrpB-like predicted nucleotidyltransferase (UPF0157 family)